MTNHPSEWFRNKSFAFSPNAPVEKSAIQSPPEEAAILTLAPFSVIPKISFENIKLGQSYTKNIVVKNPQHFKYQLKICKTPPPERNVQFNWIDAEIDPDQEIILCITWTPKEVGSWRESVVIVDNFNFKRNITINFKCPTPQKIKKSTGTKPKHIAYKKHSPIRKFKLSPRKKIPDSKSLFEDKPKKVLTENFRYQTSPQKKYNCTMSEYDKENSPLSSNLKNEFSIHSTSFKLDNSDGLTRRGTYTMGTIPVSSFTSRSPRNFKIDETDNVYTIRRGTYVLNSKKETSENFDDSLETDKINKDLVLTENCNLMNILQTESFAFTPVTMRNQKIEKNIKRLLQSESFSFTPVATKKKSDKNLNLSGILNFTNPSGNSTCLSPLFQNSIKAPSINITMDFDPKNHSTELKNISNKSEHSSVMNPKTLFKEISPNIITENKKNISSSTYIKDESNNSHSTYLISPKANDSTSSKRTYTISPEKDENSDTMNLFNCNEVRNVIEADLWCKSNKLDVITEENISEISDKCRLQRSKRKATMDLSDCAFAISPPKRFVKNYTENSFYRNYLTENLKTKRQTFNMKRPSKKLDLSKCRKIEITETKTKTKPFVTTSVYSDILAPYTLVNPFMSSQVYYDDMWLVKQMIELKKLLNAILTPPSTLNVTAECRKINIAKILQQCHEKDLVYAPTKEIVSAKYHTNSRLDSLRRSSIMMYKSQGMSVIVSKISNKVENEKLIIRKDKNLHLDVGLQQHVIMLLLCYNPLWLRIGLETIYDSTIPLESNSDIMGLSTFIACRLLQNPHLIVKNKHVLYTPAYAAASKKFSLRKFLLLVYYLDYAKNNKLIGHDPCLFCKNAQIKESKEILLSFSRELLSAVDITRVLGFKVTHIQTYIDEFDYAVADIGVNLRDGIRLVKVVEIILVKNELTKQLRAPPISKLQKIHNVKVAIDAIKDAGFDLVGDIAPKDVVEGHREKTLSLLWQIIYNFQAPRLNKAATMIQKWWRSFPILIKRNKLLNIQLKRQNAAIIIQYWYRSLKFAKHERQMYLIRREGLIKLQRYIKTMLITKRIRKQYLQTIQSIQLIQRHFRAYILMKRERKHFIQIRKSVIIIQTSFRKYLLCKRTQELIFKKTNAVILLQSKFRAYLTMKKEKDNFIQLKTATIFIQNYFRSYIEMKRLRNKFLVKRKAIILIQNRFRSYLQMKNAQNKYIKIKFAIIIIQHRFREYVLMKKIHTNYIIKKNASITIQRYFRAYLEMKKQQKDYIQIKSAIITLQHHFRLYLAMKYERANYIQMKNFTVLIQTHFRAYIKMKKVRCEFVRKRKSIILIQNYFRRYILMKKERTRFVSKKIAATKIQQYFRAYLKMKEQQNNYKHIQNATLIIKKHFKGYLMMKHERINYLKKRNAVIVIQRQFRNYLIMEKARNDYAKAKYAVTVLQKHFRAYLRMKKDRYSFILQKNATIKIQHYYRNYLEMKNESNSYNQMKNATIKLQTQFRAYLAMKDERVKYLNKRNAAKTIQKHFQNYLIMKQVRSDYIIVKNATITMQKYFRNYLQMKRDKYDYTEKKFAVIAIQRYYRAYVLMKKEHSNYIVKKNASIMIQQYFRGYKQMKKQQEAYIQIKFAAVTIQNRFRMYLTMKNEHSNYLKKKDGVITIQRWFRGCLAMKQVRFNFLNIQRATVTIQKYFRGYLQMKAIQNEYLKIKFSAIVIQRHYRANKSMKKQRLDFLSTKKATIMIQNRFRANLEMIKIHNNYFLIKKSAMTIQKHFRSYTEMKHVRMDYLNKRMATIRIQKSFRNYIIMKQARLNFITTRKAIVTLQKYYRSYVQMKELRKNFIKQKISSIVIQRRFRSHILMKKQYLEFVIKKKAIILIQRYYRTRLLMKKQRNDYVIIRKAVITIQYRLRAYLAMKHERIHYLNKKNSAIKIEEWFRNYLNKKQIREKAIVEKEKYVCAVIVLQNHVRAYLTGKYIKTCYVETKSATITIQRYFRKHQAIKHERHKFLLKRNCVIIIQRAFRNYLLNKEARQRYLSMKRQLLKSRLMNAAAVQIQKVWRGYKVRSKNNQALQEILLKSIVANNQARPEHTIGEICRNALEILSSCPSMKELIRILSNLDFVTRLIPSCAEKSYSTLIERMYVILNGSNRSMPDMETCVLSTSILINLVKYPPSSVHVWMEEYLETVLHSLLHWSDKDGSLFTNLCTLLWLLAHKSEYAEAIIRVRNAKKILLKAHTQCSRRQKMLQRIKPTNNKGLHSKANTKNKIPSLKPDWGVLNKDNPRCFINPLFGMTCLMKILHVETPKNI